jgi:hypothetical protein
MKWFLFLALLLILTGAFAFSTLTGNGFHKPGHSKYQQDKYLSSDSLLQITFHDDVIQKSLDAHETKNAFSGLAKVSNAIGSLHSLIALSGGQEVLKNATGQDVVHVQDILHRQYAQFVHAIGQNARETSAETENKPAA